MLVSYFKPFPSISLKVLLKTLFIDIYNPSIWCRYFVCCWSAEEIPFTAPHWQRRLSHPLTWEKRLSTRLLKKNTPRESRGGECALLQQFFSKWWNWWNNSKRRIERERPVKDTPIPFPVNPTDPAGFLEKKIVHSGSIQLAEREIKLKVLGWIRIYTTAKRLMAT